MSRNGGAFVRAKVGLGFLGLGCLAAFAGFAVLQAGKFRTPYPLHEVQLAASQRMAQAEKVLKDALTARGIPIEAENDLNMTGLIGPEWTALTTTLGIIEAKRSTLNPNFAALLVRYFHDVGLEPGDVVAIGASGSFPGLALATFCAAREMGLRALTIASYGSSMYGATRPEFTIPDMMRILSDASLVPNSLIAVSPGSDQDYGGNPLFEDARTLIASLAARTGVEFIHFDPPDLKASITRRLQLFRLHAGGKKIKCFVNVGGASPNSGTSSYTLDFPQGLVIDPPRIPASADRGLVYEFASQGVPIINLLNVRLLAQRNGLPYDPVPLPKPGEGGVYENVRYSKALIYAVLAFALGLPAFGVFRRRKSK